MYVYDLFSYKWVFSVNPLSPIDVILLPHIGKWDNSERAGLQLVANTMYLVILCLLDNLNEEDSEVSSMVLTVSCCVVWVHAKRHFGRGGQHSLASAPVLLG